jgi:hypothetical protein
VGGLPFPTWVFLTSGSIFQLRARIPQSIQAIAALWWNSIRTTETITQLLDFVYVDPQWDKSIIKSIQVN